MPDSPQAEIEEMLQLKHDTQQEIARKREQEQTLLFNERLHELKELEEAKAKELQTQEWHDGAKLADPRAAQQAGVVGAADEGTTQTASRGAGQGAHRDGAADRRAR